MTAKEFFEFKQKPENSERKFVQVEDKNLSSKYSVIFIEANKELYKKCNAEHSEDMRRKIVQRIFYLPSAVGQPISHLDSAQTVRRNRNDGDDRQKN